MDGKKITKREQKRLALEASLEQTRLEQAAWAAKLKRVTELRGRDRTTDESTELDALISGEIARREETGFMAPGCSSCEDFYTWVRTEWPNGYEPFAPRHRCHKPGHYEHCTADQCW